MTNYLLLINNHRMINIPAEDKGRYCKALNYANAKSSEAFIGESQDYEDFYLETFKKYGQRSQANKYKPLTDFLDNCHMESTNDIVREILDYKTSDNNFSFSASQVF